MSSRHLCLGPAAFLPLDGFGPRSPSPLVRDTVTLRRASSSVIHYVYLSGYTKRGPVCVTWGRKQQMIWRFFDCYCDELYAIVDDLDKWRKGRRGIDVAKLRG